MIEYNTQETPEQVAERFSLPIEWARLHTGRHHCVDGRAYNGSCLVTDPSCDQVARSRMARNGGLSPLSATTGPPDSSRSH